MSEPKMLHGRKVTFDDGREVGLYKSASGYLLVFKSIEGTEREVGLSPEAFGAMVGLWIQDHSADTAFIDGDYIQFGRRLA